MQRPALENTFKGGAVRSNLRNCSRLAFSLFSRSAKARRRWRPIFNVDLVKIPSNKFIVMGFFLEPGNYLYLVFRSPGWGVLFHLSADRTLSIQILNSPPSPLGLGRLVADASYDEAVPRGWPLPPRGTLSPQERPLEQRAGFRTQAAGSGVWAQVSAPPPLSARAHRRQPGSGRHATPAPSPRWRGPVPKPAGP